MGKRIAVVAPPSAKEAAANGAVAFKVLNPRGEIEPPPTLIPTPRVTELAGKKI
jgi:hypothetical protein